MLAHTYVHTYDSMKIPILTEDLDLKNGASGLLYSQPKKEPSKTRVTVRNSNARHPGHIGKCLKLGTHLLLSIPISTRSTE